jgi:hypothetical protein
MNMRLLLDDSYAPIASEIGFLKYPAKSIAEFHIAEANARPALAQHGQALTLTHGKADLAGILDSLLPLTSVDSLRKVYVQTNSEWTAFFSNAHRGPDLESGMSYMARRLGCMGVRAGYIPNSLRGSKDKGKGRYGACTFQLFAPHEVAIHNNLRSVQTLNDGGRWCFTDLGEVQPYEEVEAYKAKRIRDRFTPEMLDRYLTALGIHAFDEQYYASPDGYYRIEKTGKIWPNVESFTLAEVRAEFE